MAICARGSVLVFYAVFAVFFTSLWGFLGGGEEDRSGRFSGSGADGNQIIFIWPK